MLTLNISFFGQYRPLVFSADTLTELRQVASKSIQGTTDRQKISEWIDELAGKISGNSSYSSVSAEHGQLSVSIYRRSHDPFLDTVTCTFPHYPGADYSAIVN